MLHIQLEDRCSVSDQASANSCCVTLQYTREHSTCVTVLHKMAFKADVKSQNDVCLYADGFST